MLLLLLVAALDPSQQSVENWKIYRKEINPKTLQEEIIAIIEGARAVVTDLTPDREIVELEGIRALYYTEPRTAQEKSQIVNATAPKARLDGASGRLTLVEEALLVHEDGTVIKAPAAVVLFTRIFTCSRCGIGKDAPGKCPVCAKELKQKTRTSVEAERGAVLTKPGLRLTGEGLRADDRLGRIEIARHGHAELQARPADLAPNSGKSRSSVRPVLTTLSSNGPMTFTETLLPGGSVQVEITAREEVFFRRFEPVSGDVHIRGDEVEMLLVRPDPPPQKGARPDLRSVRARGNLSMEDNRGLAARADTLHWEVLDDEARGGEIDVARLGGAPLVEVRQGASVIRARKVEIERQEGVSRFNDEVSADVVPQDDPAAKPLRLSSRTLVLRTHEGPEGARPGRLEARGDIRIGGLFEQGSGSPGTAQGDLFVWNFPEERGALEGTPVARIAQEGSLIAVPRVVLQGRSTAVLQGPKWIKFSTLRDGRRVSLWATCEGDLDLVSAPDRTRMRLRGGCRVRTDEAWLYADRMTVTVKPGSAGVEDIRAYEKVRAVRPAEGLTVYGDRLRYDPAGEILHVEGRPSAVADRGHSIAYPKEIRFHGKTQTTELREVRIVIYESRR